MRASALSKWLNRHRSPRKPRRTILGVQSFEARTVPAALTGSVYQDLNNNGARDGGEPGIAGVKVQLVGKTDGGQAVHMSATTDAQGAYSFTGLASGSYMLIEMHAAGFKNGTANPGSHGGTALGPNVIKGIDVCGCDATGYNFGEVPAPACSNQSHGKGSDGKGSGGKGTHDRCDNRQSHGKGSGGKGSSGKGSHDRCSTGSNGKGSDGKGSGGKQSHDKCSTESNGKGSDGKGSGGKGSHDKCDTKQSHGKGSGNKGSNGKGSHDMCGGKVKGNNGVGNGLDPQPPGNPRVNDGPGTAPGTPGNRGGK